MWAGLRGRLVGLVKQLVPLHVQDPSCLADTTSHADSLHATELQVFVWVENAARALTTPQSAHL